MSFGYKLEVINKKYINNIIRPVNSLNVLYMGTLNNNILSRLFKSQDFYYITRKDELLLLINYFNEKLKIKYNYELSLLLFQNILLMILNDKINSYIYFKEDIKYVLKYCEKYKYLFNDDFSIKEKLKNKEFIHKLLLKIQNDLIYIKRESYDDILNTPLKNINLGYYNSLNTIVFKLVSLHKTINFKNNTIIIYCS